MASGRTVKQAQNLSAIVRGAKPLLGEGSIADSIMPREYDLFG